VAFERSKSQPRLVRLGRIARRLLEQ